jgi:hypothetical protein
MNDIAKKNLEKVQIQARIESNRIGKELHDQHYQFAHRIIPCIVESQFDELIHCFSQNTLQDWIIQIWQGLIDDSLDYYSSCVFPFCDFVKSGENIGVIYFQMPSPRQAAEALYTAIVFLIDDESPSTWLRCYFTLEMGCQRWLLGRWENDEHHNLGEFPFQPTIDAFISHIVLQSQLDWF